MAEYMKRYYKREEEFLDEFPSVTRAVTDLLKDEWEPNYDCNDKARSNRDYFLSTGELHSLTFDGATVYEDQNVFSSAQIILKSSKRIVTVRVKRINEDFVAEKIVDKHTEQR
jgi:hypothetical protein